MTSSFRRAARDYFSTPSSKGFSAYRTGGCSHQLLSLLIGHVLWGLLRTRLDLPWVWVAVAIVAAIGLLWGVGWFIGVSSHYNPLIPGVLLLLLVVAAALQGPLLSAGLVVGWVGHLVWLILLPEQRVEPIDESSEPSERT